MDLHEKTITDISKEMGAAMGQDIDAIPIKEYGHVYTFLLRHMANRMVRPSFQEEAKREGFQRDFQRWKKSAGIDDAPWRASEPSRPEKRKRGD